MKVSHPATWPTAGASNAPTLDAVLRALGRAALGAVPAERSAVYLIDAAHGVFVRSVEEALPQTLPQALPHAVPQAPRAAAPRADVPAWAGIVGRVGASGRPEHHPLLDPDDALGAMGPALAVPLRVGSELLGVLALTGAASSAFSDQDMAACEELADRAAPQIRHLVMTERISRMERRLAREQGARHEAERLLESRSRELFEANQELQALATGLESRVEARTAEIIQLKNFYETVLDRLPTQLAVLSPTGEFQYANPAEVPDPERRRWIIGRTNVEFAEVGGIPMEVAIVRAARIAHVVRERHGVEFEETLPSEVGPPRVLHRLLAPIFDETGTVVSLVRAGIDITDARAVEEQLRQSQKMEAVGLLAGGIAHDFNNLLTIITGIGELLYTGLEESHPDRPMIDELIAAAKRGGDLTRKLLAFSRRSVVEARDFDPNEAIRQTASLLQRLLTERVTLLLDLGQQVGLVHMDPGGFDQLLLNLAANAHDAMPAGGAFAVRTSAVDLTEAQGAMRTLPAGRYVSIEISDTGAGMTSEVITHAFEPFFTTKAVGQGTGLGLASVYGIVTQCGGQITIDSAVGEGTTFRILLPSVEGSGSPPSATRDGSAAPSDAVAAPVEERGDHGLILVAEDEAGVRKLVCRLLENLGYQVLEAEHGIHALTVADAYAGHIDLLLTDVRMPHMNGLELAETLQRRRPGMRVLYMSGYIDDDDVRDRVHSETVPPLDKPFTTAALTSRVRAALRSPAPQPDQQALEVYR